MLSLLKWTASTLCNSGAVVTSVESAPLRGREGKHLVVVVVGR